MIVRLRKEGIRSEKVLWAIEKIPRHFFVSPAFVHQAYEEKALPVGHGQTISHPYTVARMTELLELKDHAKILEIGTGSGYQTAVLCALGANVYSVEIVQALADQAVALLKQMHYRFTSRVGDGSKGWAGFAPYDAIIVTAGAPAIPKILLEQVSPAGGRLLIPVGDSERQKLTVYRRHENNIETIAFDDLKFVPLVGKFGWKQ